MNEMERTILENIAKLPPNQFTGNHEIANYFGISSSEAIYYMQELSNKGFIRVVDVSSFNGERWITTGLTPKGRMAIEQRILG